jgi:hypothetical protein
MNYPTDDESLAQTNEDVFDIAQVAVNLAMAVITSDPTMREHAIEVIWHYGDWEKIKLPTAIKRALYVRNYGEDEVEAMVEAGEVSFEEGE